MSSSYLSEATAALEFTTYDYSQPTTKTVDLGEEFTKKGDSPAAVTTSNCDDLVTSTTSSEAFMQTAVISSSSSTTSAAASSTSFKMSTGGSLPPLTYTTTTTIPTIATQEETGVLYCNLDDLSRYIPDNFSFDQIENIATDENVSVQVLSLPSSQQQIQSVANSKPISFPNSNQRLVPGSSVQIQVKQFLTF